MCFFFHNCLLNFSSFFSASRIRYEITRGNFGGAFAVKNMTGAIYVAGPLDYETRKRVSHNSTYHLDQAFFHRFCGIKHNRFSETLSLRYKSLSLGDNYLSLRKNLEFRRIFLRFYTEKLHFLPKISLNFPDF